MICSKCLPLFTQPTTHRYVSAHYGIICLIPVLIAHDDGLFLADEDCWEG